MKHFIFTSILSLFLFSVLSAQTNCQCQGFFNLSPNTKCLLILDKEKLGIKNCPGTYIVVQDKNPKNLDTIEVAGVYDYGLYNASGTLLCSGKVNALLPDAPILDSVDFIRDTLPFTDVNDIDFKQIGPVGTFDSPRSFQLLLGPNGKYQSWEFLNGKYQGVDFQKDTIPNLGIAYFRRTCQPNDCQILVSINPNIQFPSCEEALKNNLYLTLTWRWQARDCNNNYSEAVLQNIAIRRPQLSDFHWNLSVLQSRKLNLNYGECTLNTQNIPLDALSPVLGKTNLNILKNRVAEYTVQVKDKLDTICNQKGLRIQRQYLLRDECAKKVVDTFTLVLSPGSNTANWLTAKSEKIVLPIPKDSCVLIFNQQLDSILKVLGLQLKPVCPVATLKWRLERFNDNYFQQFFRETWDEVTRSRIIYGRYRIHFTMIDQCQNLCTKTIEFVVKSQEELKVICIEPFQVSLSNNYFRAQYRFARPEPIRQTCGSVMSVRRILPINCLTPELRLQYDIDRDGDIFEHLQLIKSGPFAGQYFSPWDFFLEAFACDRGKTVHFEAKVMTFDGRETICSSYFNVVAQNPNQAKIEIGKTTTPLNQQVRVPLRVTPFLNTAGLQFALKFDPTVLRLDSVHVPHASLKKMAFGYPGQGANPRDRVAISWSYDGRTAVSLPNQTPLIELCFTPLKTGSSKIWVDTLTFTTELIDVNTIEFQTKTSSGEVQVLSEREIVNQQKQTLNAAPLLTERKLNDLRPDIVVFPNPASERVNVALPESWPAAGWIVLKDMQGRVVLRQGILASLNVLNTQMLAEGVFFVEVYHEKQLWVEKLILIKR